MNLLIVDDDAINRKLLRAQLEADGHRVLDATNGVEALAVLDGGEAVDGIVSDILMPDMDGYRLCLEIRKNARISELPFVLYTSTYSSPQDQALAKTVGADDYLSKPSPTPVIINSLRRAAQRSREPSPVASGQGDESYVLKQYNASLVRKLEQRNSELEEAVKSLKSAHEAIDVSEEKFRQITENIREVFWLTDPSKNEMLYISPAYELVWGRGRAALYASPQSWLDSIHPEDRERVLHAATNEQMSGTYDQEYRIIRPDGSLRWIHDRAFPVRNSSGEIYRVAGVAEDITERKSAAQKIEKLARVRSVTSAINAAIVRSRSRQELFDHACRIAVEDGGFGVAWIGLFDPRTLAVTPATWAGAEADATWASLGTTAHDVPEGQGSIGLAVRTKTPAIVRDMSANPAVGGARRAEALARGFRSAIALPLTVEDEVAGVFALFSKERNAFDDEEITLLSELAGNIAFAMEHLSRQQKIEKLSRIRLVSTEINAVQVRVRDREALLRETCRIAAEHGKFEMVWIGTVDTGKQEVRGIAWHGFSPETARRVSWNSINNAKGTLGEAIRTREPAVRNDIESQLPGGGMRGEALKRGCHSTISLPLVVENIVVGLIVLFAAGRNFFDKDELGLLGEVATDISFALDHIGKQQKIEKLTRIRSVSSEINAAIVRSHNKQSLFEDACRIAVEHGRFGIAWIGELDTDRLEVRPVAHAGLDDTSFVTQTVMPVRADGPYAQGVLPRAVRERRAVFSNDISLHPERGGPRRQQAIRRGFRSVIVLPLFGDGAVTGILSMFAREIDFFDDEEVALLTELAGNISFALEHMARQDKVNKLSRVRHVLGEINSAIVRVQRRSELFEEACRIAADAGRFPFVWIGIYDRDRKEVRPAAWAGNATGYVATMQTPRAVVDGETQIAGAVATTVRGKTPVVSNDIQNDPRIARKQMHLSLGTLSLAVLPLIVAGETAGVLALHAREAGFFDKEEVELLSELASDIAFAMETIEKQEKLDYLSYYDELTGLPNRALFMDRASQQMRARDGESLMVAMILLNLERFRRVNESFGRQKGDRLLILVTERLEKRFRGRDLISRYGADGFGVVIRGLRDTAGVAHALEDQVMGCFREPFDLEGSELRVAARAGIALFPGDGGDADTLFSNAEAALKQARQSGERYLFYASDMNARAAQILSLETRLRRAVEAHEFVLHYQPKINLATRSVCGLEALLRWQDPDAGLIAPAAFIPLLEETGLILDVGRWAITKALAQHLEWTARGCAVPRIAVNVSAIQLQQPNFADVVIEAIQAQGDNADALELEVTESLLMKDVRSSIRKLSILRGLGVHIAMDDFGTGYSSLSYIARLPINSLKIDRSFITGMGASPQEMSIVTTIIALARSLNLKVVAEGVETEEQSRLLTLFKCDEAQGFLFGKPQEADEIESLLRAQPQAPRRR